MSRVYGMKTVRTAPHSAVSKDVSTLTFTKLTLECKRGTRDALKRPMRALQSSRSIPIFAGEKKTKVNKFEMGCTGCVLCL